MNVGPQPCSRATQDFTTDAPSSCVPPHPQSPPSPGPSPASLNSSFTTIVTHLINAVEYSTDNLRHKCQFCISFFEDTYTLNPFCWFWQPLNCSIKPVGNLFLVTLLFMVCNLSLTKSFCRHVFIFPAIKLLCEDSSGSVDRDLVNGGA